MMKNIITFEASARKEILSYFDKTVDAEGYIVEKDDPSLKVITPDGDDITLNEFAGLRKGSEIFIKSDLTSLMAFFDSIK
jgi:hypothetical protein